MKEILCLSFIILAFMAPRSFAQPPLFSYEKFIDAKGDSLLYRLLYPDYYIKRKFPLVIFLHGSGEAGNDNNAQLKWGVLNFAREEMMAKYPALVIAPQCPPNMEWANVDEKPGSLSLLPTPSKPMLLLHELIKQLIITMPVDSNRIYITGLSMGGYGVFDAIERYPGFFAAAVPVCGGGDTSRARIAAKTPLWIFHGADDPAVDPGLSQNMLYALTKAGATPGFTQYPETGHFCWLKAYTDALMIEWLFRQHK